MDDNELVSTIKLQIKCGHWETVKIAEGEDIDIVIEKTRNSLCKECQKIFRENERKVLRELLQLPNLKGSNDVVSMADDIRLDFAIFLIDVKNLQKDDFRLFFLLHKKSDWWILNKDDLLKEFTLFR